MSEPIHHPGGRMTWANRITIARLLLTPMLIIGFLRQAPVWPLVLFTLAALTDVLDGAAARWRNERTTLGRFLDPIADKLLLIFSYLALTHVGVFPMWVFVVVFARDLLILIGWNVVSVLIQAHTVEPRWLGKSTTLLQMGTVIVFLAFPQSGWTAGVLWAMVAATALSTIDYVWLGARKIGELG